jgi:hypothetical protein
MLPWDILCPDWRLAGKCVFNPKLCLPHLDGGYKEHLSWSEMKDYVRKIYPKAKAVPYTIIRSPVDRVISEYKQWKRGWCCAYFFSGELQGARSRITLEEFVRHKDCPANNRQAWMLGAQGGQPSGFPQYFMHHYGNRNDYVDRMNRDQDLLLRAKKTIDQMPAVLMQDDMAMSVVMLVFNFGNFTRREPWFRFRHADACYEPVHPHLQQLMSSGDEGVKHTNVASTLRNDKKVAVDGTVREVILERNKLDIALYEYAHEKYLRDLKAMKEKLCLSW